MFSLSLSLSPRLGGKMPPPLEIEKPRSFRLSQAVAEPPIEAPTEESEVGVMVVVDDREGGRGRIARSQICAY